MHPSAAAVVLHFPPLHAELIGGEGTLNVSSSFPASEKGVTVYFLASEHPPSSTGGDQEAHSPAASAAVNGGSERFSSAYDEPGLTALTATGCSYASAFDSGKAGGTMVCDRDVTMILNSSVLNAACGTPASIGHGVKGTLSPGSIQSVVSHRHGNRTTSTSVSSPGSYSSRYMTCSWSYNIPLTVSSTRLVRWCRLLSSCIDGLYPPLASLSCVPASPAWEGTSRLRGGCDVTVDGYGFLTGGELPEMYYDTTDCLDSSMHEEMFLASQCGAASGSIPLHETISSCDNDTSFGEVNYFLCFLDFRLHEFLSLRVLAWGGTLRRNGGDDVTVYGLEDYLNHDVMIYDVYGYSNSDVMIYANYDTSIYNVYAVTGFYAYRDIYDESLNFDFTTGDDIDYYNLSSMTLDDAVINDSGRKDTLSIDLNISKSVLLWTASIMIAAFVLYLSTTTSTTTKVGMKDISTGLVKVFGMIRFNLLEGRNTFERKGGSAIITSERNNDCECKDAYLPIMSIRNCVQNGEREQACSFPFPVRGSLSGMKVSNVLTVLSNMGGMLTLSTMRPVIPAILLCDPLFVYVLQCLVRSRMDHRDESHRVCSAASVMSKHGQQIRLYARTSSHSSHTSCYARTLEDQFAWSSRTCLPLS